MFFDPHLVAGAEEEAEETTTTSTTTPVVVESTKATTTEGAPPLEEKKKKAEEDEDDKEEPYCRVVGTIERIEVELGGGTLKAKESVRLPDGRVVEFEVPKDAKAGDVIEIEVARKKVAPAVKDGVLKAFFERGIEKMEQAREMLKKEKRPGPALVELQQTSFDELGVDREAGCKAAAAASSVELVSLRQKFALTAQRAFLTALEDRKPKKLVKSGRVMERQEILDFFDACNTKMALPETKMVLTAYARQHKKMPNELIVDMQKDMLENFGFEREYGCKCLNNMERDYPNDQQLRQGMHAWAVTASETCKQAMTEADPKLDPNSAEMRGMKQVQAQARAQLATMSADDKTQLLEAMKSKVTVFSKLASSDRLRYVNKLPDKDKLDFVKAQILLMDQLGQMSLSSGV